MNQERLKELVTEALTDSIGESVEPSVSIVADNHAGRIEIPLVFANNFAELILREIQ